MWLMRKNRNHLGLEEKPERPPPGAAAAVKAEYKHDLAAWLERKDTCVSSIYEAVQKVPEALEVVEQYILEKEILPGNAINKEVLAKELLDRLVLRFRGEIQDELGDLNKKFTHFIIQPDEKVCTGIDRLNGIIQKMTQHGQAPTDAAKLAKLKEALEIPSLNQLWLTISLKDNPSYADIVSTCKRYDKAMEQQRINLVVGEAHTVSEKVVCSYPRCGKPGHTAAHCWKRKRHQQIEQLKRAGRSGDPQKPRKESKNKFPKGRSERKGTCFVCGIVGHRAFECPDRVESDKDGKKKSVRKSVTFESERVSKKKKPATDWNRFTRREERDTDDDEDFNELHMMNACKCNSPEELHTVGDDEYVYLDSCASKSLFIVRDQSVLESFVYSGSSIQTTRADAQLTCLGSGRFKDWTDIRVCNDAVKNICSAGILRKMGYGLQLLRVPRVVRLCDGVEVIVAAYSESGMPYVGLSELLHLPDIISKCDRAEEVLL